MAATQRRPDRGAMAKTIATARSVVPGLSSSTSSCWLRGTGG